MNVSESFSSLQQDKMSSTIDIMDSADSSVVLDGGGTLNPHKSVALLLLCIPFATLFGNMLVIMAVFREKSLQTVTNMLIVSLAVADFLVALCVMPFAVYFELNSFIWGLGPFLCNLYMATDVACSTASILNLLAISLDRYAAITRPIAYAHYGANGARASVFITVVWSVSVAVALPILFGVNEVHHQQSQCEFTNAYFIIVSSLLSFFLPCFAMIVVYTIIFRRLRQRRQRQLARSTRLQPSKSDAGRINNALIGGANFVRQIGNYFKYRADQILLEISFQTSSYPTMTSSSESSGSISSRTSELLKNADELPNEIERFPQLPCLRSFGEHLTDFFPYIDSSCNSASPAKSSVAACRATVISRSSSSSSSSSNQSQRSKPPCDGIVLDVNTVAATTSALVQQSAHFESKRCSLNGGTQQQHERQLSILSVESQSPQQQDNIYKMHNRHDVEFIGKVHAAQTTKRDEISPLDAHTISSSWCETLESYRNDLWKRMVRSWTRTRSSRRFMKRSSKQSKQMRREHKATVTLAIVLAVFLFCWVPFFTLHLTNAVCMLSVDGSCVHFIGFFLTTWLGYFNSSLNPLIYTVFDQRFRKAFRQILGCPLLRIA